VITENYAFRTPPLGPVRTKTALSGRKVSGQNWPIWVSRGRPHDEATHNDRLIPALAERNKGTEGIGQEAYPHAFDLCFFVFEAKDGSLSAIVFSLKTLRLTKFSENSNRSLRRGHHRAQVLQGM
jgi:hypothetical protein